MSNIQRLVTEVNKYTEIKERLHKEINAFLLGAANNDRQFTEMLHKWGLTENDTDQICSLVFSGYIRKCDNAVLYALSERFEREKEAAIAADITGNDFIRDMFYCEIANHKYCVTNELDDLLDVLGLTIEQVYADKRLLRGLKTAINDYLEEGH